MHVQTVKSHSAQWFETALWGNPQLELMNHSFSLYTEECHKSVLTHGMVWVW